MKPRTIRVSAYAKVNMTLDVLHKRPDGYHGIATVMQTISIADEISISLRDDGEISLTCSDPTLPADKKNLAYRAAEVFIRHTSYEAGVDIQLRKNIPSRAGLGGGSSDAATVLRALNDLLAIGMPMADITGIAAALGSDVPFFLHGGTASCRGRGELVTPLPDSPAQWFVITKPDVDISTADAYEAMDRIPNRISNRGTGRMEDAIRNGDKSAVFSRMSNDFEEAIVAADPHIALLQDELMMARAKAARLCGSGSAVFGAVDTREQAEEIARMMRLKYKRVFVCRSITRAESLSIGGPLN